MGVLGQRNFGGNLFGPPETAQRPHRRKRARERRRDRRRALTGVSLVYEAVWLRGAERLEGFQRIDGEVSPISFVSLARSASDRTLAQLPRWRIRPSRDFVCSSLSCRSGGLTVAAKRLSLQ